MKHSAREKKSVGRQLHKGITFSIGLVTIGLLVWGMTSLSIGIYRMFRPAGIYAVGVDPYYISGAAPLAARLEEHEKDSPEYFSAFIENFIKQDFPAFQSVEELNDEYLISFGLWQAITMQNTDGVFNYSGESGNILVPGNMVEKLSSYYFDYGDELHHRTVDLCSQFTYNQLNGCYTITAAGVGSYLVPKVVDVAPQEDGTTVVLTVDCYENSGMDENDVTTDETKFRKRVLLTLQNVPVAESADVALEDTRYMYVSMTQTERPNPNTTDNGGTEQ